MKAPLLIAATMAATLSVNALAGTSTPGEFRGYKACVTASEAEFRGLVTERNYLIENTDSHRNYYINATVWKDGDRVDVGFSCQTTRKGELLSNSSTLHTRYAAANRDSIQVAGK